MKDLVAKRYVKALVDGRDLNSVTLISEKLNEVSKAFKSDKFNSILASSDINEVEKTASTVGVTTIRIPVSNAFHSKYMDDASNHILEMSALNLSS